MLTGISSTQLLLRLKCHRNLGEWVSGLRLGDQIGIVTRDGKIDKRMDDCCAGLERFYTETFLRLPAEPRALLARLRSRPAPDIANRVHQPVSPSPLMQCFSTPLNASSLGLQRQSVLLCTTLTSGP
ncbi:hypothetical protein J6590_082062 [Homalodisca vitripennis]|nr:hypothetical protein J6590_014519 [Homalodisca vitripennis]KAG8295346.1 hypothetical protein J6590_082062 [Homalodisca vitripennis]